MRRVDVATTGFQQEWEVNLSESATPEGVCGKTPLHQL